ncbi:hypothetical protein XYCOK13_30050 [Xylanibacillus composti]|uniref:SPOR domain-containing protein n=1 Tax=Xylanibacillus composti TaxID=1572762 RepID=A0A8J4H5Q8_9BACL|nr:SPOR domain-containing protein [Xylanibacillus composti]GIQ70181.1 hypothetical protein XYCOK13_30050 [Xylanibacillus composti]
MSKARITYRFDKHGNRDQDDAVIVPIHEEPETAMKPQSGANRHTSARAEADKQGRDDSSATASSPGPSLNEFTQDFGSWTSPFDAEVERLERIIRGDDEGAKPHSMAQQAGSNANRQASQDGGPAAEHWDTGWLNGETGYMRDPKFEGPIVTDDAHLPYRHSRKGTPWLRLIASVTGAVVTGIVLGLFVLTVFTNGGSSEPLPTDAEQTPESDTGASPQTPPVEVNFGDGSNDGNGTNDGQHAEAVPPASDAAWNAVTVPGGSYHMIQYGVFSSREGAQTAVQELSDLGLAGAFGSHDGNWYVYAGVSEDKDDILGLAQQLKQRDFDIYVKQIDIPSVDRLQWQGEDASKVTSYFEQAQVLVSKVSAISMLHLQEAQPAGLESTSLDSIAGTHQQMMLMSSQISGGFEGAEATRFQTMNNALNTAVESMNAYDRNPSRSYLWQAQTAIMRFLLEHQQLVQNAV